MKATFIPCVMITTQLKQGKTLHPQKKEIIKILERRENQEIIDTIHTFLNTAQSTEQIIASIK